MNFWLPVGRGKEDGQYKDKGLRGTNYSVKYKLQGYIM